MEFRTMSDLLKNRPEWVLVTPCLAKSLLESSLQNGVLRSKSSAKYYSEVMRKGEWMENNPKPLILSNTGKLLDGNHRCWAILDSGMSIQMRVVYDIPENVFSVLGSEVPRGIGQVIALDLSVTPHEGDTYASILLKIDRYLTDSLFASNRRMGLPRANELLRDYKPHIEALLPLTTKKPLLGWVTPSFSTAFMAIARQKHPDGEVEIFLEQINTGFCERTSAAWITRETLITRNSHVKKVTGTNDRDRLYKAAVLIRGWNGSITGDFGTRFYGTKTAQSDQAFPEIL